jgi:hypothetical protein
LKNSFIWYFLSLSLSLSLLQESSLFLEVFLRFQCYSWIVCYFLRVIFFLELLDHLDTDRTISHLSKSWNEENFETRNHSSTLA